MDIIRFAQRHQTLSVFLVSFALSFLVFGNGIGGGFVLDDAVVVEKRSDLKDTGRFLGLLTAPYHQNAPYTGLFRPATMISYALNYSFFGKGPAWFHIVNIAIHALNSALAVLFIIALTHNRALAYGVGLLFLTHPIHVEAVTSIVGRAELLAFFWGVSAMLLTLRGRDRWGAFCLFLALMSKESAFAILPMIILLKRWHQDRDWRTVARGMAPYAIACVPYAIMRFIALGGYFAGSDAVTFVENPLAFVSLGARLLTAFKVALLYLAKIAWPARLSADYSHHSISLVENAFSSWEWVAGLALISALGWIAVARKETVLGIGAALFLFSFAPVSNLIIPIGTIMGERLMYLPSLGILIIAAAGAQSVLRWKYSYAAVVVVVGIAWGTVAFGRNQDWISNERLLTAAADMHPRAVIARTGLAALALERKDLASARAHLAIAQEAYADYAPLQNLLGIIAVQEGDLREAEQRYLKAIGLNARSLHAHRNIANLYLSQRRYEEALAHLRQLMALNPSPEVADLIAKLEQALR